MNATEIREFCVEICARIGDEYTGPNMATITFGSVREVIFYGKDIKYKATMTDHGVVVTDEAGATVLHIPDMKMFPF